MHPESADILIGNLARMAFRCFARFHPDQRSGMNNDHTVGNGVHHLKLAKPRAEQGGPDAVAVHDRKPVDQRSNILAVLAARRSIFGKSAGIGERHESDFAGGFIIGLDELDFLIQPRLGVIACDPVHLDDTFATVIRVTGHDLGRGLAFAFNHNNIADFQAQGLHVFRINARKGAADILGQGFLDFQRDFVFFHGIFLVLQ